ncbi:MAG: ATP-binding protein [Gemmatimonadaceae bacterium]
MNDQAYERLDDLPGFVSPGTPIDLTNCDREPIHIPGAVQPHGVLLALHESTLTIALASESVEAQFGVAAADLADQPLASVVGTAAADRVRDLLVTEVDRRSSTVELEVSALHARVMDATLHRSGGLLLLELEPASEDGGIRPERMNSIMRSTVDRLESAENVDDLAQGVAREMREITGFDRVWVYRFHPDWHGEIIGEAKRDDIETWMGMHYPASDIPAQARALFLRNVLRVIPDVRFVPSPLVPIRNPLDGTPLDLGDAVLRSVSPIHVQYLVNMGVTASLVISLIHRGKLWGLISGHHYSGPRRVPYGTRVLCEFMAQALALQIGTVDRLTDREHALEIRKRQGQLLERIGSAQSLDHALTAGTPNMATLVDADGAAVIRGGDVTVTGRTPTGEQIRELAEWVRSRPEEAVEISALGREFPAASAYADVGSGLLALPISRNRTDQLLWFRGEQRQTVRWAGDPRKAVTIEGDGSARLHPRGSFALWEEEVRGTSLPWLPVARDAAREIRRAILDMLIHRAEEVARLNEELVMTNALLEDSAVEMKLQTQALLDQRELRELALSSERRARAEAESANRAKADFLAIMSHELRTPLNAIGGYAQILALGMRGPVTPEQITDLDRIQINQRHLLGLINSILNFTRLETGSIQFRLSNVAVSQMLASLDALVGPQMRAKGLTFGVGPCDDVTVRADEDKVRQILLNMTTNALKFTREGGTVEMRCRAAGNVAEIRVIDSGIGIDAGSIEAIFEPFVQINRNLTDENDQGVGLGLAISRELARNMGGDLTATSGAGIGSTFLLTLPVANVPIIDARA